MRWIIIAKDDDVVKSLIYGVVAGYHPVFTDIICIEQDYTVSKTRKVR